MCAVRFKCLFHHKDPVPGYKKGQFHYDIYDHTVPSLVTGAVGSQCSVPARMLLSEVKGITYVA